MSDTTEKITYVIEIDAAKGTASAKKVADTFKDVADNQKKASSGSKEYGDALDKLAPGINSTVSGLGGVLQSFKALILSPIGLTLAAVGAAFGIIKDAIQKSEPALDFIEDVMTRISSTAEALLNNLQLVGKFFGNLLVGDLGAAASAFGKLTDEISKSNDEAQRTLDLSRDLEDAQIAYKIATADTTDKINALMIASRNKNLTLEESENKVKEAIRLEGELAKTRKELADKEADIGVSRIALAKGVRKEEGETFDAFVKRLIDSEKFGFEEQSKIADLYEKTKQAVSDSLAFQEKAQNKLDEIAGRRREALQLEIDLKNHLGEANNELDTQDIKQVEVTAPRLIAGMEKYQKTTNQTVTAKKAVIKMEQDHALLLQGLGSLLTIVAGKNKELAIAGVVLSKLGSIAQIVAATAVANAKAVAASPLTAGMPWVAINSGSAALSIAQTIASAAQAIAGFATGGLTGTRILSGHGKPIYRGNGDNMLATVRTGEVILNEQQQARLGGARTFAAIGVPGFDTGGITSFDTRTIAGQVAGERSTSMLLDAIKNTSQRVLVIEEVEAMLRQRVQILEGATV